MSHFVALPLAIALGIMMLAANPASAHDYRHDRYHHRGHRQVVVVSNGYRHHHPVHHRYARRLADPLGHLRLTFVW